MTEMEFNSLCCQVTPTRKPIQTLNDLLQHIDCKLINYLSQYFQMGTAQTQGTK